MKAYSVSDKDYNLGYSYIVFAETRGKAINHALHYCDDAFESCEWTEMRAIREPRLDRFYHGNSEMDWCNMEDRVAMVRYAGFQCSGEVNVTSDECEQCAAHEWCDRYDGETR